MPFNSTIRYLASLAQTGTPAALTPTSTSTLGLNYPSTDAAPIAHSHDMSAVKSYVDTSISNLESSLSSGTYTVWG